MSESQRQVAREIATKLQAAGKQAWLVGGLVRDLALGLKPSDVDITTDARPEEVEAVFDETIPVGRAFGTVIVRIGGLESEVTTFRSDSSYSDARHPDSVTFSKTPEEDALRRDFTCNALYLDPLSDRLLDPTGGLADLGARRLRCVGDPKERFGEDALRILRLARFAAEPGLEPEPDTIAAARALAEKLRLIAPERRLREVTSMLSRSNTLRAMQCLSECDALRWALFDGEAEETAACRERVALFRDDGFSGAAGLAVLFGAYATPSPRQQAAPAWRQRLKAMRPSRELLLEVQAIGLEVRAIEEVAALGRECPRSRLLRTLRSPEFRASLAIAQARASLAGTDSRVLSDLARQQQALSPAELRPEPLIVSSDLEAAGVPRGPLWSELLSEAETRQLDGEFVDRQAALVWLGARAEDAQDGGKSPRRNHDAG